MGDNQKIESVEEVSKSEQELAQEFIKSYEDLCKKHGFQIVVNPAFKARDDGTFSVVLQSQVGRLPKEIK